MGNAGSDMRTAVVVVGGVPPRHELAALLPPADLVVAADSGLHGALALGLVVDVVIGDMDSVDADVLAAAESRGVAVQRVPHDKDAVDTELALLTAVAQGARRIVLVTGGGGRLDHQMGVLAALVHPGLAGCEVHALWDTARVRVMRGPETATITGTAGSIVGIVPAAGAARGVTTAGLRWSLADEDLEAHSTRGVSNEMLAETATVAVRSGYLHVVQPHAVGAP